MQYDCYVTMEMHTHCYATVPSRYYSNSLLHNRNCYVTMEMPSRPNISQYHFVFTCVIIWRMRNGRVPQRHSLTPSQKGGTRVRTLTFQIIGLFTWLWKNLVTGPHRVDRAWSDPKDRTLAGQLTSGVVEGRKIIKKNLSLLSPNHCRPILYFQKCHKYT
jgi:hypothetical protein